MTDKAVFFAGPMMQKLGLTSVFCLHYDLQESRYTGSSLKMAPVG